MTSTKQTVFIVGATGYTGSVIAATLAKSPEFVVKGSARFASLEKPKVKELEAQGVQFIPLDLTQDSPGKLEEALKGVDVLVSTVLPFTDQKPLFLAAKKAGVKRVVPSDFGPAAPKGSMPIQDIKIDIQEFIKENNIPYTFIQVGWWAVGMLPFPHSTPDNPFVKLRNQFYGTGHVKVAYTIKERIGDFVARIIADPRTLNKTVMAWDGEITLEEAWKIASQITGENFDDYHRVAEEEAVSKIGQSLLDTAYYGYVLSLYFRGENTVENAVAWGALDAHVLYPDYEPYPFEEAAKEFYKNPKIPEYDL